MFEKELQMEIVETNIFQSKITYIISETKSLAIRHVLGFCRYLTFCPLFSTFHKFYVHQFGKKTMSFSRKNTIINR